MKEILKKHVDTIVVLGGVVTSLMWMNSSIDSLKSDMNGSISSLKKEMNDKFAAVDLKFASLESDIRNINTILICKDIMPKGIALDTKQGE
ncbi:MAG: hypothetical protein A3F13_02620 [Gammaproteobacteria bacterium RIFCSPHIGHO2_12_FULL_40_19]|nr:MAG: hypothetical protein A3F13_02620 [Gammaproteobacteria bacterium RIFCSPHIGHO2_12_FULL_40_19]